MSNYPSNHPKILENSLFDRKILLHKDANVAEPIPATMQRGIKFKNEASRKPNDLDIMGPRIVRSESWPKLGKTLNNDIIRETNSDDYGWYIQHKCRLGQFSARCGDCVNRKGISYRNIEFILSLIHI